jgi:regulatory protein
MTKNEALTRAMKLCSVKEYAPSEIEQKLMDWGITKEFSNDIIAEPVNGKFLDEFRMARYFANDKLRFNKWGKVKIKFMLQQKKIGKEAILEALKQIAEEEYITILNEELTKKRKSIRDTDDYIIKAKLFQFASGRGFESDLIYKLLDKTIHH